VPVVLANETAVAASQVLLALAVIVIAGPLLAEKARLPGLIGFMVGGMLVGPYVLGWLDPGQFDAIGGLGILYLMFLAGLELDMDIFNRYRASAARFGLLTFTIPFGIGWLVGLQLGFESSAAILSGSIWASHTLVALPIVKRAGLSSSRTVAVAAGATIITDTLALVVLAVVSSGATEDGGAATLVKLVVGLAALIFTTLWIYPRIGHWFFAGPGTDRSLRFMFLLGAMALAGLISEYAGIDGIVGAFFAGLGLNRLVPKRGNLMERIEFVGTSLFVPAFLISVGMLIDPALIFDVHTLKTAGAFLLVVFVGKGLAAAIGGRLFKFGWAEIGLLFSLTIGQAAATLAATLVGVNIGLFDDQVLNAVVLTVLVTVLISSILTRVFTGLVRPEHSMTQAIGLAVVVPIPEPEGAEPLLRLAGQIARADTGTVTPLLVVPPEDASPDASEEADARIQAAALLASGSGTEAQGIVRVDGSVKNAVLNVVAEKRASLVMLAAPKTSRVSQAVFGGPIESIGADSPVPVALAVKISSDPGRLVVVIPGRPRTLGDQVDTQVALDITNRLAGSMSLPVVAMIGAGGVVPDLPEGSTIERTPLITTSEIGKIVQPGDLLVAPLTSVRRFLGARTRDTRLPDQVGLLITAGPFRLRKEGSASESVSSVFGYTTS
jgi:Na+:H+ antiporter